MNRGALGVFKFSRGNDLVSRPLVSRLTRFNFSTEKTIPVHSGYESEDRGFLPLERWLALEALPSNDLDPVLIRQEDREDGVLEEFRGNRDLRRWLDLFA